MIIPRDAEQVRELSEKQKQVLLEQLVEKLDDLDCEDYFGTEGWRHRLFGED